MLGLNFRLQVVFELLPNVVVFLFFYVKEKLNSCTQQSGWSVYTVVYLREAVIIIKCFLKKIRILGLNS